MIRVALLATAIAVAAPVALDAAGLGILTLSGDLEKANRGPSKDGDHTLLGSQGIVFDRGFTMSMDDLVALAQVERRAVAPEEETVGTVSGPRVTDVLKAVGAAGETVTVTGLDGYEPEIPMAMIEQHDPILAVARNGAPMAIGDQGPLVMIWPSTEDADLAEHFNAWEVWAVHHIGVK